MLVAFLLGIGKRVTYGAVLVLHAISTFSALKQYLSPFQGPNLLFFAAWPALAACIALYLFATSIRSPRGPLARDQPRAE